MRKIIFYILLLFAFTAKAQLGFQANIVIDSTNKIGNAPGSIRWVDMDLDNDLDLLLAANERIVWYENLDGLGSYSDQKRISNLFDFPKSTEAADFDGDGDVDVVSTSNSSDRISWFTNVDGQGETWSEQILSLSIDGPRFAFPSDIDGDGDQDIVCAAWDDTFEVFWFENLNGQGAFSSAILIEQFAGNINICLTADIDGDNDLDLVIGSGGSVSWYENLNGQGNFGNRIGLGPSPSENIKSIDIGDIDGDGDNDIIAALDIDDRIIFFENLDGQGTFSAIQDILTNISRPASVELFDLDGDNDLDILSASLFNDETFWLENTNGQGNFSLPKTISLLDNLVRDTRAGDVDGDGDADVVTISDYEIALYLNTDGAGTFADQIIVSRSAGRPQMTVGADLDGDGDTDLLSVSDLDDKVAWYENLDGQGNFSEQHHISSTVFGADLVQAIDIDNDGDMDVFAGGSDSDLLVWYENIDGLGTFGPETVVDASILNIQELRAADMDGDNDLDLVVAGDIGPNNPPVNWYENTDGQGAFGPKIAASLMTSDRLSIHVDDVDADGDMDILSGTSGGLFFHENTDGQGLFVSDLRLDQSGFTNWRAIRMTDVDNDNDLDILAAQFNNVFLFENIDGLGTFAEEERVVENLGELTDLELRDLNLDGDLDIVIGSDGDDTVYWAENLPGAFNYGPPEVLAENLLGLYHLGMVNINGDSRLDFVTSYISGFTIAWFENLGVLGNTISGQVRYDLAGDGCDSGDPPVGNFLVTTNNGNNEFSEVTQPDGGFSIQTNEGDFITELSDALPFYFDVSPAFHESNFTGLGNNDIADFCITSNQTINDLTIAIYPISDARPGFDARYRVVYGNVGTTVLDGQITFLFDDSKMDFLMASQPVATQTTGSLVFDYDTLAPFETRSTDIEFNILPPPINMIDDVLTFEVSIDPISGDFSEVDNTYTYDQLVIGSFDPNDIQVVEGETIFEDETDAYLHYIIRFQNTGTASAINVRVDNVLDMNLDWETFQLETLSHSGVVEIEEGNDISFIFDNINLPPQSVSEEDSQGFITYKIKPVSSIALGDSMSNNADIFFDFNEPIRTNTVTTTVIAPLSNDEVADVNFFSMYPNPARNIVFIESLEPIQSVELFSQQGRLVHRVLKPTSKELLLISHLASGIYFVKVVGQDWNTIVMKLVKK